MEWFRNQTRKLVPPSRSSPSNNPPPSTSRTYARNTWNKPGAQSQPSSRKTSNSNSHAKHLSSPPLHTNPVVVPVLTRLPRKNSSPINMAVLQTARLNWEKELEEIDAEFDSPRISEILKLERVEFKKSIAEYQRKVQVLTSALEEKAESIVELAHQARGDEVTIKDLTHTISSLEADKERILRENADKDVTMNEINRRIETITRSLDVLAIENLDLQALIPLDEGDNVRAVFEEREKEEISADPGTVQLLSAKIEELEFKIKHYQSQIHQYQKKGFAFKQHVQLFEKKIQKMQEKTTQSMTKEAQKRKASEFELQKLEKKVQELDLVLGQREEQSSTSNNTDEEKDSDQEDQIEEEKNPVKE